MREVISKVRLVDFKRCWSMIRENGILKLLEWNNALLEVISKVTLVDLMALRMRDEGEWDNPKVKPAVVKEKLDDVTVSDGIHHEDDDGDDHDDGGNDYRHIKWIEDLVPRTMWMEEPIGYDKHALWGVSHWGHKRQQFYGFAVNQESARNVYSKRRIIAVTELKIVEWHSYKHLDWITLTNLTVEERFAFNVSLQIFTRSIVTLRHMEDLQLGVESYQKKLNLTKPDTYLSDLKCKKAYTAYSDLQGFIYQNNEKKNRLMQIDELHKFSDGTLTDVRTALDDRLKGIRMRYLPQTI
nr:hypothetical protein [Tanacetum cinerariifolium]